MINFSLNFTQILNVKNLTSIVNRFPLTSISCVLGLGVYWSNLTIGEQYGTSNILAVLVLLGFFFIGVKLFCESQKLQEKWCLAFSIIGGTALAAHSLLFSSAPQLIFQLLTAFFFIFISPFLLQPTSNKVFWNFNAQSIYSVLRALLAVIISFIGISLILLSINYLFDTKTDPSITYSFIFILGLPFLIMAKIPIPNTKIPTLQIRLFEFVLEYFLIPILIIYGIILNAYVIKILITGVIPKGDVVYMVKALGCTGLLTLLAAWQSYSQKHKISVYFYKYFPLILLLPLCLLTYAISIRIYEYGITIQRYYIFLSTLGLISFLGIHFLKLRKTDLLRSIYLIIFLLLFVGSFGPLRAEYVSGISQKHRLEKILIENEMLQDGNIVPIKNREISDAAAKEIIDITEYLDEIEQIDKIAPWFEQLLDNPFNYADGSYQNIISSMGINYQNSYRTRSYIENTFFYNNPFQRAMALNNFQWIKGIVINQKKDQEISLPNNKKGKIQISKDYSSILIRVNDQTIETLTPFKSKTEFETFAKDYSEYEDERPLPKINIANPHFKGEIVLRELQGKINPETESFEIMSLSGYLLFTPTH